MLNRLPGLLIAAVLLATTLAAAAAPAAADVPDRHAELSDPSRLPPAPAWPAELPTPMLDRTAMVFYIVLENWAGGSIYAAEFRTTGDSDGGALGGVEYDTEIGHVLTPVSAVNPRGFTASGWRRIGAVCASAVNAIHVKTAHDYGLGKGVIFSILPIEQAQTDPRNYKSYLSHETSLQTDIPGGQGIFGGGYAPLVGSRILLPGDGGLAAAQPVADGWVPAVGERFVIEVVRRRYNPEYIEFENRFGGLIRIKELGEEPYPIGQVLKPVVGIGRFLGTQYAGVGRIRAAHPGVICISTSPEGTVGGFQIIPRDHAMSAEMGYTRYKTQWMVVGPLWALDPSWEGLPPLFSDYIYPSYLPAGATDADGDPVSAMEIYLSRFTVRGRYSDAEDPDEYVLLHEADYLDNYALKTLTHVRIYFPVNLRSD